VSRVEAIVARAYKDLDLLYNGGGGKRAVVVESVKRGVGRPRVVEVLGGGDREVQCGYVGCMEYVQASERFCELHTAAALRRDIKRHRAELERVMSGVGVVEIDLRGLSGQGIIDKVFEVTGELIPVCRKSKVNVIRHAQMIADRLGIKIVI
jgi:hypothetical protein